LIPANDNILVCQLWFSNLVFLHMEWCRHLMLLIVQTRYEMRLNFFLGCPLEYSILSLFRFNQCVRCCRCCCPSKYFASIKTERREYMLSNWSSIYIWSLLILLLHKRSSIYLDYFGKNRIPIKALFLPKNISVLKLNPECWWGVAFIFYAISFGI
jgi:hypothetical protein